MKLLYAALIALSLAGPAFADCPGNRVNAATLFQRIEKEDSWRAVQVVPEKMPAVLKALSVKFGGNYESGDLYIIDFGSSVFGMLLIKGDCSDEHLPLTITDQDLHDLLIAAELQPDDLKIVHSGISM